MLSPFNLLMITAGLCLVMLLVLSSLLRSGTPGIKEWTLANTAAFVALLLFAGRTVIPDVLSIEFANGLLSGAVALIYIGVRKFFQLKVPLRAIAAAWGAMMLGIVVFHYAIDSIAARIGIVSLFHSVVAFFIGWTIVHADKSLRFRYPYLFTACVAFLFAIGHFVRGTVYLTGTDTLTSILTQASAWNLVFLSIGTLVLPLYSMGAVMMAHDRMMTKALNDANHDFLTSVWTRRALFEFAERELARSRRMRRKLSLLVFDVDHFKQLNDGFGHAAGDQVLIAIAKCTQLQVRSMDYVARIGGEEFAILLPEVDEASAYQIAERLRQNLHEQPYPELKKISVHTPVSVSVSIGVATTTGNETISELLNRADRALYQAKTSGRNRVCQAEKVLA